jgi:hypothetical protein
VKRFLILIFIPFLTASQPDPLGDVESVRETILNLFEAMEQADGELLRSVVTEDATLNTVQSSAGGAELSSTDMNRFIEMVEDAAPGMLREEILYISVNIDGDLATAWMDYHFYRGEEFSHCGVNSMNLIRKNEGWKIFSIVDTRRTEDC